MFCMEGWFYMFYMLRMGTNWKNVIWFMVWFNTRYVRETKLARDLLLTLLYVPSNFGEDWIYGAQVGLMKKVRQGKCFLGK